MTKGVTNFTGRLEEQFSDRHTVVVNTRMADYVLHFPTDVYYNPFLA
ncbi:MAG: hypothetical protein RR398_01850 [Clostridia bacterium]